jgi:hypothetical protein
MAGYGKFQGYEPAGEGAYRFIDQSGSPWLMHGSAAADLKRRLDESAGIQPMVAGPGGGPVDQAGLAARMNAAAAQNNPQAAQLEQSLAGAPPPPIAAAPAAPAPTGGQAPAGGGQGGFRPVGGGMFENTATGEIGRFRGPTAGSKGGLALQSETRQDVAPVSDEFLADQDDLQIETRLALQEKQDAGMARAAEEAAYRREQEKLAINQAAESARRNEEIEKQVKDYQSKYDKAEKDVASAKVDPDGASNFLDTIAMTLGAIGANLRKGPNFVADIVQTKIARRIAAQEHEINIKRETKNDLAKMLDATKGDRGLARQALEAAYTRKAQATFESKAALSGNKELAATYKLNALQFQDAYALKRKAFLDGAHGKVTQHLVNLPSRAASSGGFVAEKDQFAVQGKILDIEGKKLKNAQEAAGPAGKEGSAVPTERSSKIALNSQAIDQSEQVLEILGDKTGDVIDPGQGGWAYGLRLDKADRQKLAEATQGLGVSKQIGSGMGATKDDAKLSLKMAGEGGSFDERKRAAQRSTQESARAIAIEIQALPASQQKAAFDSLSPKARAHVEKAMKE